MPLSLMLVALYPLKRGTYDAQIIRIIEANKQRLGLLVKSFCLCCVALLFRNHPQLMQGDGLAVLVANALFNGQALAIPALSFLPLPSLL
jgi:hypothetical protein